MRGHETGESSAAQTLGGAGRVDGKRGDADSGAAAVLTGRPTVQRQTLVNVYQGFSSNIATEFPLRGLADGCGPARPHEIRIEHGEAAEECPGDPVVHVEDGDVHLKTVAGRLSVDGGRRIVADGEPSRLEPYLLGPGMGALLYQRGVLPLHACVVEIGESAVAFVGASGAGKSTLAATFYRAGYEIGTDDIAPVNLDEEGCQVQPSYPAIKLDPDGPIPSVGSASWTTPDLEKRFHRIDDGFMQEPRSLERIYVLEDGPSVSRSSVPKSAAFRELMEHSYCGYLVDELGLHGWHFDQCSTLAERVPVARLTQPRTPAALPKVVSLVERDLAGARA